MRRKDRKIGGTPPGISQRGTRLIVAALCLMVGVVPLAYLPGIYEYVLVPKWFALHLCVALTCLGWLLQTRWGRDLRPVSTSLLPPALGLMGAALLSAWTTTHPLDTLVELLNQAALVTLFLVTANTLTLQNFQPVLWTGAVTGLAVALIGILQYHGLAFFNIPSSALPSATFANRNMAAEYLICAMPLSGLLFLTSRRRPAYLLTGLSASLMGAFLVYTRTRAAWVGLAGALLCVGGLLTFWPGVGRPVREALRARMDRPRRTMALGFLVLFLALSALPPLRSLPASQRQAPRLLGIKTDVVSTAASIFQKESLKDASVTQRLAFWSSTLRMVADHPLFGVGPGGWIRAYPPYDDGKTITTEGYHRRPHNDYLWIASEYGLIGLGAYLGFLGAGFVCLLKMARNPEPLPRITALMFALSLLSLLGAAFFGFPKEQAHTAMFPYLLLGVAAGGTRRIDLRARNFGPLLLIFLLIISLGTIELNRRRLSFERHFHRAFSGGVHSKNWQAVLTESQRAIQQGTFQSDILFFKGLALQHLGRYAEAETVYRQLLAHAPHAWYGHDGLGFACLNQGSAHLEEALKHFQTALALCPSAIYIRNSIGIACHKKGNSDQAEKEFRAALQSMPGDAETHLNLGSLYKSLGQLDSAVVHYQQTLRADPAMPLAHLSLAHTYLKQGRLQDAFPHFEKALPAYPDDPNIHWGLGLALEAGGRLREAETAYRKVVSLQQQYAQGHLVLGNVLYAQGSYQEALNAYRTFLSLSQSDTTNVLFAKERIALCEKKTDP